MIKWNVKITPEFGEDLRIASIDKNGVVDILYYKNQYKKLKI